MFSRNDNLEVSVARGVSACHKWYSSPQWIVEVIKVCFEVQRLGEYACRRFKEKINGG